MSTEFLLPERFSSLQLWKDFIASYDKIVNDEFLASLDAYVQLRDPDKVEEAYTEFFKANLGLYIPSINFNTEESRRLLDDVPYFYEKSGTRFFMNFISYVRNTIYEIQELYTNGFISENLNTLTSASSKRYRGSLAITPISRGSVTFFGEFSISPTDRTIDKSLAGTGRLYLSGTNTQVGTIDYDTGEYDFTATSTGVFNLTTNYYTDRYQEFVGRDQVVSLNSLSNPYGKDSLYLTNHVNLIVGIDVFNRENLEELSRFFYSIAPTVLVLRDLVGKFPPVTVPFYASATGYIVSIT